MTILGPEKNIKSLSRQDIQYYIKTHYTPERMVIAASGAVDHGQLVRLATEKFGALKPAPANKNTTFLPAQYIGGEYRERQDEAEMVNMAIAFETCGWKDADTFPLLVMHSLLGSWDKADLHGQHSNSRLVATVSAYRYAEKIMPFNTIYSLIDYIVYILGKSERRGFWQVYSYNFFVG